MRVGLSAKAAVKAWAESDANISRLVSSTRLLFAGLRFNGETRSILLRTLSALRCALVLLSFKLRHVFSALRSPKAPFLLSFSRVVAKYIYLFRRMCNNFCAHNISDLLCDIFTEFTDCKIIGMFSTPLFIVTYTTEYDFLVTPFAFLWFYTMPKYIKKVLAYLGFKWSWLPHPLDVDQSSPLT